MAELIALDTTDEDLADEALDRPGSTKIHTIGGTHACH